MTKEMTSHCRYCAIHNRLTEVHGRRLRHLNEPFFRGPSSPCAGMQRHAIFHACFADDVGAVAKHLSNGVDVHQMDNYGWTPLLYACALGRKHVVDMLLSVGFDVEAGGHAGRTSLMIASCMGQHAVIPSLLAAGANVNAHDLAGVSVLTYACVSGNRELVELLMYCGAVLSDIDNSHTLCALALAVSEGDEAVCDAFACAHLTKEHLQSRLPAAEEEGLSADAPPPSAASTALFPTHAMDKPVREAEEGSSCSLSFELTPRVSARSCSTLSSISSTSFLTPSPSTRTRSPALIAADATISGVEDEGESREANQQGTNLVVETRSGSSVSESSSDAEAESKEDEEDDEELGVLSFGDTPVAQTVWLCSRNTHKLHLLVDSNAPQHSPDLDDSFMFATLPGTCATCCAAVTAVGDASERYDGSIVFEEELEPVITATVRMTKRRPTNCHVSTGMSIDGAAREDEIASNDGGVRRPDSSTGEFTFDAMNVDSTTPPLVLSSLSSRSSTSSFSAALSPQSSDVAMLPALMALRSSTQSFFSLSDVSCPLSTLAETPTTPDPILPTTSLCGTASAPGLASGTVPLDAAHASSTAPSHPVKHSTAGDDPEVFAAAQSAATQSVTEPASPTYVKTRRGCRGHGRRRKGDAGASATAPDSVDVDAADILSDDGGPLSPAEEQDVGGDVLGSVEALEPIPTEQETGPELGMTTPAEVESVRMGKRESNGYQATPRCSCGGAAVPPCFVDAASLLAPTLPPPRLLLSLALTALERSSAPLLWLLSRHGLSPNTRLRDGTSTLHVAVAAEDVDLLEMLLRKRASPDMRANARTGATALCLAASQGSRALTLALLRGGASVNVVDIHGDIALHRAARLGHAAISKQLVRWRTDVNYANARTGYTALHEAAAHGQVDVYETLCKLGADTQLPDCSGVTAVGVLHMRHTEWVAWAEWKTVQEAAVAAAHAEATEKRSLAKARREVAQIPALAEDDTVTLDAVKDASSESSVSCCSLHANSYRSQSHVSRASDTPLYSLSSSSTPLRSSPVSLSRTFASIRASHGSGSNTSMSANTSAVVSAGTNTGAGTHSDWSDITTITSSPSAYPHLFSDSDSDDLVYAARRRAISAYGHGHGHRPALHDVFDSHTVDTLPPLGESYEGGVDPDAYGSIDGLAAGLDSDAANAHTSAVEASAEPSLQRYTYSGYAFVHSVPAHAQQLVSSTAVQSHASPRVSVSPVSISPPLSSSSFSSASTPTPRTGAPESASTEYKYGYYVDRRISAEAALCTDPLIDETSPNRVESLSVDHTSPATTASSGAVLRNVVDATQSLNHHRNHSNTGAGAAGYGRDRGASGVLAPSAAAVSATAAANGMGMGMGAPVGVMASSAAPPSPPHSDSRQRMHVQHYVPMQPTYMYYPYPYPHPHPYPPAYPYGYAYPYPYAPVPVPYATYLPHTPSDEGPTHPTAHLSPRHAPPPASGGSSPSLKKPTQPLSQHPAPHAPPYLVHERDPHSLAPNHTYTRANQAVAASVPRATPVAQHSPHKQPSYWPRQQHSHPHPAPALPSPYHAAAPRGIPVYYPHPHTASAPYATTPSHVQSPIAASAGTKHFPSHSTSSTNSRAPVTSMPRDGNTRPSQPNRRDARRGRHAGSHTHTQASQPHQRSMPTPHNQQNTTRNAPQVRAQRQPGFMASTTTPASLEAPSVPVQHPPTDGPHTSLGSAPHAPAVTVETSSNGGGAGGHSYAPVGGPEDSLADKNRRGCRGGKKKRQNPNSASAHAYGATLPVADMNARARVSTLPTQSSHISPNSSSNPRLTQKSTSSTYNWPVYATSVYTAQIPAHSPANKASVVAATANTPTNASHARK